MIKEIMIRLNNDHIGKRCKFWGYNNIFGSYIGDNTAVGFYTEIGNAVVGNNCRIGPYVFICGQTRIGDNVFIGPHTVFCNDKKPNVENAIKRTATLEGVVVEEGANIGANCTILPGVKIGEYSTIGAGSVVTKNVPPYEVWCGNPAKRLK